VFIVRDWRKAILRGSDTEISCVFVRESVVLNISAFVVIVCGRQCREQVILDVMVFVVRVWGGKYTEELILNILCML